MLSPNGFPTVRLFLLGALDARTSGNVAIGDLVNQPKRIAIVAYLALVPDGRVRRRDELLALFWPESGEGSARNALSQTLYRLRSVLGEAGLVTSDQDVRVNKDVVWCDAVEMRAAAAAGDNRRVLELYRGDLLDAFHVRGAAPEFDMWLARERDELRDLAIHSAWKTSDEEAAAGNQVGAAHWARLAARLAPTDEDAVRNLMLLLDGFGDRSGALRAYEDFASTLAALYEIEPSPELTGFAASLRERAPVVRLQPVVADAPRQVPPRSNAARNFAIAAALALVAVIAGLSLMRRRPPDLPVIAVGNINLENPADSTLPVEFLLSTSLARIEGLSVIAEDRVREVAMQLTQAGRSAQVERRAALQAGAAQVIEGVLSRRGNVLRLDFRRVDAQSKSLSGHVVEGATLYDIVDLATDQIAKDLGLSAPATRAGGRNASLVAYRLYEQGLQEYFSGDHASAHRLFRAALTEDSTFAMAAFNAARTASEERDSLMLLARALAAASPDQERLFITANVKQWRAEPGLLEVAETLAMRFPRDPDAAMVYGGALAQTGRFADAVQWLTRAAELDSLSIYSAAQRCRVCEAHRELRNMYMAMDSPVAVERVAREWLARYPESTYARLDLAEALEQIERFEESAIAFTRAHGAKDWRTPDHMTGIWLRQFNFKDVDAHWAVLAKSKEETDRLDAYWGSFISFRMQGRLRDALAAGQAFHRSRGDPLLEALALLELGRFRESAALFEREASKYKGKTEPMYSRAHAWHLTHAAAAYAGAGDTARLRVLEDTVRVYGARSAYVRDQRLHQYVRGLRLRLINRPREAARAFDASLFTNNGYVRVPLEIARTSLLNNKPERAIEVLRPALLGPVSAAGLYASRTELLELLGDAYERTGQRDSAIALYSKVLFSWQRADPELQARVEAVRARLTRLEAGRR